MGLKAEIMQELKGDVKTYLEDLNRENVRLSVLVDLAKLFGGQTEFDTLLRIIIDQTCLLLEADRATIFIVDNKTQELWSRVGSGISIKEIRFSINKGIASLVARTKKNLRLNDAYEHPEFNPEIDKQTGYKTQTLLSVPMMNSEGNVIGVFQVINKINGRLFDLNDEAILKGISSLAAIRLENILLVEELKVSEKLSIVGKLTSAISHEMKNLLSPLSLVELIPSLEQGDVRIKKYCDIILRARDQIFNLLNEIREIVVDEQKYEMKPENLDNVINEVVMLMKFDTNLKDCVINTEMDVNLPPIMCNQGKIKQVLVNLIRNAAQAIPANRKGKITVNLFGVNDEIIVTVSDNGCGIPPENMDQIWLPFFSTKKDTGTGLGLDICKKIILAHEAKISCESKVGEGTIFILSFKPVNKTVLQA